LTGITTIILSAHKRQKRIMGRPAWPLGVLGGLKRRPGALRFLGALVAHCDVLRMYRNGMLRGSFLKKSLAGCKRRPGELAVPWQAWRKSSAAQA
jgi:hypothetical protein